MTGGTAPESVVPSPLLLPNWEHVAELVALLDDVVTARTAVALSADCSCRGIDVKRCGALTRVLKVRMSRESRNSEGCP